MVRTKEYLPHLASPRARSRRDLKGSVLVIVMMTLLFATFALVAMMEKASNDLLVDQRDVLMRRLRKEAYSALEVTLAVLEEFREAGNGLRSPAEGWSDPLAFAEYTPTEDRQVHIAFEDESGKISLPRADANVLTNLFRNWQLTQQESETLADALMGWMHKGHVYRSSATPQYDQGAIPYEAPGRPLRSFQELAAIEKVREFFYDEDGRPNDLWQRFTESVSLFDFQRSNLNGARPDTLAAVGQFDLTQQQNLSDYLSGGGNFQARGPNYFRNPTDAQQIAGPAGNVGAFNATISALRIIVTVYEGKTLFRVNAVIAPPGGATTVQATAQRSERTTAAAQTSAKQQNQPNPKAASPAAGGGSTKGQASRNLRYPFTLLEVRENAEIAPAAPPPSAPEV